ncbi:uncharacterized protein LOC123426068 [Hordeum vulgare subsp. vulgare]|uniref:uncharacterized protein LOC123426068 n=1 Tax=Hordeum vulgare subsp. vulgare TaxID=112509 RepID=UPI001D1A4370|nr:uncharacterized protein LOC123426068 [Hordeum vulgare subsp. vulgare]
MENRTAEGRAIYETITQANEAAHLRHQTELDVLIVAAVGSTVEAAVSRSVGAAVHKAVKAAMETAVNDMQAYTDGAEADLLKQIHDLRVDKGISFRVSETDDGERSPKEAEDTGAAGFRSSAQARIAGVYTPYVPPPARGIPDLPRPT